MTSQRRAEVLLLSITVVWGSTFVITKSLLTESSPLWYTSLRFFLSALILFIAVPRRILSLAKEAIVPGVILGIFLFVGFALQTVGIQYTTASKSAFFTGMLVVLTPIVHFLSRNLLPVSPKPLKIGNLLGVLCAAFGLYLLTAPEGGFTIGDGLTLGCAVMFAFYIVYLDVVPQSTDKLQLTFVMFVVCGLLGAGSAAAFEEFRMNFSVGFITALLYLTILATVVAMAVQNRYQGDTSPTRAAVIFAMEPVVAGICAWLVRGENIGIVGAIGAAVILCGLMLSEFSDEIPGLRVALA